MARTIVWNNENEPGVEKLNLDTKENSIVAKSHVIGGDADLHTKWDAEYEITCGANWHVRDVSIYEKTAGRHLIIHSDGAGNWTNESGKEIEVIHGCIDIDFRATPFSNTFPIKRLQLAEGETATIEVAYINAPDLEITKEQQVYTRLSSHTWKFIQPSADFEATITVDDEGFVVDYPGLFTRAS
ncbi:MAG TPA: putative glycolipid-binding domain-containing protein [Candidatus Saccharimonadales bacterium]|nr:putative glycolipid-binding domain-containing protein [Candidatus Saccharimonadales bacterium]